MGTVSRWLMLAGLLFGVTAAWAEEEMVYSEGPVILVSSIRTKYGMFDEYMKFLDGTYKRLMEEEKKAGLVVDYGVYQAFPHNPHEPDIFLTITFKNWAAFDGLTEKVNAIEAKLYGSMESSNKAAVDRDKVREVLGSQVIQKLQLK
jgi:hypothetical protein